MGKQDAIARKAMNFANDVADLTCQRDELLETLEAFLLCWNDDGDWNHWGLEGVYVHAEKAIARIKGES